MGLKDYRLFRTYQLDIHPFSPTLVNVHNFETELCGYVQRRRHTTSAIDDEQRSQVQNLQQGMSTAWISTLFALLACGAQFCNEATSKRQEQSSLYGKCASALSCPMRIFTNRNSQSAALLNHCA
jgi:hypothetical protein